MKIHPKSPRRAKCLRALFVSTWALFDHGGFTNQWLGTSSPNFPWIFPRHVMYGASSNPLKAQKSVVICDREVVDLGPWEAESQLSIPWILKQWAWAVATMQIYIAAHPNRFSLLDWPKWRNNILRNFRQLRWRVTSTPEVRFPPQPCTIKKRWSEPRASSSLCKQSCGPCGSALWERLCCARLPLLWYLLLQVSHLKLVSHRWRSTSTNPLDFYLKGFDYVSPGSMTIKTIGFMSHAGNVQNDSLWRNDAEFCWSPCW